MDKTVDAHTVFSLLKPCLLTSAYTVLLGLPRANIRNRDVCLLRGLRTPAGWVGDIKQLLGASKGHQKLYLSMGSFMGLFQGV